MKDNITKPIVGQEIRKRESPFYIFQQENLINPKGYEIINRLAGAYAKREAATLDPALLGQLYGFNFVKKDENQA